MKRINSILLFFFLLTINRLSAQIVYDTIPPDELEIGGHWWEELFMFKDFEKQALTYFSKINFKNLDCYGETVFVETVFEKDGALDNTRIVKSASSICDSIAFTFVNGLKDWVPGIRRGTFVDIPFVFPIIFDSVEIKNRYANTTEFLTASSEKFDKRKEYFDFVYSNNSHRIINNFEFFYKFLAEKLSVEGCYVRCREYTTPKRNDRVRIDLNEENSDSINFIIYYPDDPGSINYILAKERWLFYWDKNIWMIIPNITPPKKKGRLYLEKNRRTLFIGFVSGKEEPLLAIYRDIIFLNDTLLNLDFKQYNKSNLMKEINLGP